jgi:hypothetical protein
MTNSLSNPLYQLNKLADDFMETVYEVLFKLRNLSGYQESGQ